MGGGGGLVAWTCEADFHKTGPTVEPAVLTRKTTGGTGFSWGQDGGDKVPFV